MAITVLYNISLLLIFFEHSSLCRCSSFLLLNNVAFLLHEEDLSSGREGVGWELGVLARSMLGM